MVETFLLKDRKQFIRPTRYVLFALSVSALSFLAVQFSKGKPMLEYLQPAIENQVGGINNESNRKDLADAIASEIPGLHSERAQQGFRDGFNDGLALPGGNLIQYASYIGLALLPVVALFYWLCFPGRKFNFAEHLATAAYISSHSNMFNVFSIPVILLSDSPLFLTKTIALTSLLSFSYTLFAVISVYITKWTDFFVALGYYLAGLVGIFILFVPAIYFAGYIRFLLDTGGSLETITPSLWNYLKLFSSIMVLCSIFLVRIRPKRWYIGLGLGLVFFIIYCFV